MTLNQLTASGAALRSNLQAMFIRQLAAYASCHRHPKNRATHFVGIPAIMFSLLCPLAMWHPELLGIAVPGSWLVAILAFLLWMALDVGIGLAMTVLLVPMVLAADGIARSGGSGAAWVTFTIFFVVGWIFQLVGHMWEGKRPALLDNLFQTFIGPMFIVAEVLILLGYRSDLRRIIELAGARHRT